MITVAVPLYLATTLVRLPRDVEACPALMDILKSFMVWLTAIQHCHIERRIECGGICYSLSIHVGFPLLPFCILAIVPVVVLSDTGHFALAIDAMLADAIITTVAATTIMMVGLAIQVCLFFRDNKNVRVQYIINITYLRSSHRKWLAFQFDKISYGPSRN